MRKFVYALAGLWYLALFIPAGCTLFQAKGNLDKASVDRLSGNVELVAPEFLAYAAADNDADAPGDLEAVRAVLVKMAKDLDGCDLEDFREKLSKIFPKYLVHVRGDPELSDSEKELCRLHRHLLGRRALLE